MYAGWTALLWGLGTTAAGLGSAALVVLLFRGLVSKGLNLALCLSAGVLYALLFFHLLPESFEIVSPVVVLIGVVIGGLIMKMLDQFFHRIIIFTENAERDRFIRSGVLVALGIALHNFPNGVALGALLTTRPEAGIDLARAMIVHYIPEGLAMSLPLVMSRMKFRFLISIFAIAVLPTGAGAFLGAAFGHLSPMLTGLLFAVAIGSILYVATFELMKHGIKKSGVVAAALAGGLGLGLGLFLV